MKHCEQNWSGRVKIGKPTGRNLPLLHPRNDGGNTNIKTLNGVAAILQYSCTFVDVFTDFAC